MLVAIVCVCTACADDVTTTDISKLPAKAQTCLKYFDAPVAYIEIDNEGIGGRTYEVRLTDGTEIDFDKKGEWIDVDCKSKSVPKEIIPTSIANYVKANYPNEFVTHIDRDSRGYDVELSNHLDLKFDASGNFIRFDD